MLKIRLQMLRNICSTAVRLGKHQKPRFLSNTASGDGDDGKSAKTKDVLDEDLLKAIDGVANDLHPKNGDEKKSLKNTLINRLVANEKASFDAAAASASSEMLDDQALIGLLADVAGDVKIDKKAAPKSAQLRQEKRGMVLLRREIFYQAVQSGLSPDEARLKSESIVEEAQRALGEQRKSLLSDEHEKAQNEATHQATRTENEQKLYQLAVEFLEKIQRDDLTDAASARKTVAPDPNTVKLFDQRPLGIWNKTERYEEVSLGFWSDWDRRSGEVTNGSFGARNAFEEHIEWTRRGQQWEYPIDNEYRMGPEANVSFIDHVFLDRHLPAMGIPSNGPIAHFMHLVCVGLSKNAYMTAAKKREHLQWFANYFNAEKQKLVHKLHEQEQMAAQNAL